jgi:hypothetical protein
MRVYPHERFSSAMRTMRSTTSHRARPAGPTPSAVAPFPCYQFPVPARQCVRRDQRLQLVQRFAIESKRFTGKVATFGVGEADALSAQPFLEQAVLFLNIVDQIQVIAVDPSGEHHQPEMKRLKQGRH